MISIFLTVTFLISWVIDFFLPQSYVDLTMFVPGVLAIALTLYAREKLKTLVQLPGVRSLFMGFFLSVIVFLLYIFIASGLGVQTFGLPEDVIRYNHGDHLRAWGRYLLFGFPYVLGTSIFFAFGEEIGWRGYLLRKVKPLITDFWLRGLAIGVIWGIWHVPLYLVAGVSVFRIMIFLINVCLVSLCYTWIYEYDNSAWATVIAHAVHNALFNTLLPIITLKSTGSYLLPGEEGLIVTVCYTLVILTWGLLLTLRKKFAGI